jgi:hypothetical protein
MQHKHNTRPYISSNSRLKAEVAGFLKLARRNEPDIWNETGRHFVFRSAQSALLLAEILLCALSSLSQGDRSRTTVAHFQRQSEAENADWPAARAPGFELKVIVSTDPLRSLQRASTSNTCDVRRYRTLRDDLDTLVLSVCDRND